MRIRKIWKKLNRICCFSWRDTAIFLVAILAAALLCFLLRLIDDSDVYVSMIFLLAVLVISRMTDGYFYGILAAVVGVFGINYVFTYPYFAFNFSISGYPITFISMAAVAVITSAMTTQIKQQEKIRADTEKEKMRGNLLRAVSHDLRTPLTSIVGATSAMIENDEVLTPAERKELLSEVKEDAEWLIRMVENLLSITRIGGEAAKIKKEQEAAEEIVAESVRKFKKRFPEQPVSVSVPDELLMIPMDAILVEQVIINLLENAVLHGKTVTKIELSVHRTNAEAVVEVRDNGVGIPEAAFPHLFDGYFRQHDEQNTDNKRNMGIGLSVCMSIVKAHGGIMEAKNLSEGGALFRFTLPLEEEE
ncbi:sensor histidine kinase [Yeguia hominis]|uniref:histidine kinase n=1 Tax=Yeguia hominis TaxID=2763662 RepID=A0A926D8N2_9FIRM|nr:DUF4118 domain-containing protein [Yeguia hominis]MBC8534445.1 DUF4118 domain-containing protein [Yeguia hominis]